MIHGVDLYQGNSFGPASDADFVFLKASEGRSLRDTQFAARWAQLKAMGKVRGVYHFPNFGNAPEVDFAFFAGIVGPVLAPGDLIALDFEGDTDTHTWAQRTSWKNRFLALAKQRFPGHRIGIYCNISWWHGTDNNYGDFLWVADYTTAGAPRVQAPWTFHQYSTSGGVDHDVANFPSVQALRAWAGGTVVDAQASAPTIKEDDELMAPIGYDLPDEVGKERAIPLVGTGSALGFTQVYVSYYNAGNEPVVVRGSCDVGGRRFGPLDVTVPPHSRVIPQGWTPTARDYAGIVVERVSGNGAVAVLVETK